MDVRRSDPVRPASQTRSLVGSSVLSFEWMRKRTVKPIRVPRGVVNAQSAKK